MRATIISILFSICFNSFAQKVPIKTVYILEGIVTDRETFKVIPSASLFCDSLGINTMSDQYGYFKIAVPLEQVRDSMVVPFKITRAGYKPFGWLMSRNFDKSDTICIMPKLVELHDQNVRVFYMAKTTSLLSSTVVNTIWPKKGEYGANMAKLAFDELIKGELQELELDSLKKGNEYVYLPLKDGIGLATYRGDIIVTGKLTHVFLNDKKVKVTDLNRLVKRSHFAFAMEKSTALSLKYGRELLAFESQDIPARRLDEGFSVKATLYVELD